MKDNDAWNVKCVKRMSEELVLENMRFDCKSKCSEIRE